MSSGTTSVPACATTISPFGRAPLKAIVSVEGSSSRPVVVIAGVVIAVVLVKKKKSGGKEE